MPADQLADLFRRWKAASQEGRSLSAEELCADCPEMLEPLRRLILETYPTTSGVVDAPGTLPDVVTPPVNFLELAPGVVPVPGYKLVSLLGRGSFGQVWKASGPGGFSVAIKFVRLDGDTDSAEMRSLEVMKDIRHAHLLSMFGAWNTSEMLIVAMELADCTLLDRCNECLRQGLTGIPRAELLEYMHDAAKGIDFLNEPRHILSGKDPVGIQHRDIKPQNLLLVGGTVKVGDFGLAKILEQAAGSNSGSMTAAYAPPECFKGKTTSRSDQYSLAVTYCQLRGAKLPFGGLNVGQIMLGHIGQPPDLTMIPVEERPAVARALSKNSEDRFPSCRAFVKAVEEANAPNAAPGPPPPAPEEPVPKVALNSAPTILPIAEESSTPGLPVSRPVVRRPRRWVVWPWVACLIGVAIVGGLALGLLTNYRRGATEAPTDQVAQRTESRSSRTDPTRGPLPTAKPPESPKETPRETHKEKTKDPPKDPPKDTKQEMKEQAAAQAKAGEEALRQNAPQRAIVCYTAALALDPGNAAYLLQRAKAYYDIKDFKSAIEDCNLVLDTDKGNAAAYVQRGRAYSERQDYELAIEDFNEAIKIEPTDAAYLSRGLAHAQKKEHDYDQAVEDLTEAIKRNPRNAVAFRNRGVVHVLRTEYDAAIRDYTDAITIDAKYALAYGGRARAYALKKDFDNALPDYDKAIELDPRFAWAYNGRGVVYAYLKKFDRAIEDFTTAIGIDGRFIEAYENRASAYRRNNEPEKAEADIRKVKQLKANKAP